MFLDLPALGFLAVLLGSKNVLWAKARGLDIYDSSATPNHLPFNTYNYCNAPHVSAAHYEHPAVHGTVLKHVTLVMRHHKVRPHDIRSFDSSFFLVASLHSRHRVCEL